MANQELSCQQINNPIYFTPSKMMDPNQQHRQKTVKFQ